MGKQPLYPHIPRERRRATPDNYQRRYTARFRDAKDGYVILPDYFDLKADAQRPQAYLALISNNAGVPIGGSASVWVDHQATGTLTGGTGDTVVVGAPQRLVQKPIVIHGHSIKDERIEDLLVNAFEGGSKYWYIINKFNYPPGQTRESLGIEFQHSQLPLRGGSLTIGDREDPKAGPWTLDRAAIVKGLKLMADKYPRHWADFIEENDDAITADVFLQLALLGDIVYG